MNVLGYVAPIIALMVAAVGTLILVLPVAALVNIADRIVASPVAALVNIADQFFKSLFCREKTDNRSPRVHRAVVRTVTDAVPGVPDYVAPIVAHRAWRWDGTYLRSLNGGLQWNPGKAVAAICPVAAFGAFRVEQHRPAEERCHCGVHAAKTLDGLHAMGYTRFGIYGEVYLWGKVVEHDSGWRAQFAYPKTLIVQVEALGLFGRVLEALTAYGADIYQAGTVGEDTLLWTKQFGYTKEGKRATGRYVIQLAPSSAEPRWRT